MDLVVLAGGESRRMKNGGPAAVSNKAFLKIDGKNLIEIVIERLRPLFDTVIISSASGGSCQDIDAVEIADIYPESGSLGGIYSGLSAASSDSIFVIACDMPFVNPKLVKMLVSRSAGHDIVIPRITSGETDSGNPKLMKLEPLHAVYSKACLPHIEPLLKQGNLKIFDFFHMVNVNYVGVDEIRIIDPKMLSFFNINTPEDFAQAYALADGACR